MEPTDKKKKKREKKKKTIKTIAKTKTPIPEQDPHERVKNFSEVALGYTEEQALAEAERCIECEKPTCIPGCPVEIDIPGFIQAILKKEYRRAYEIIKQDNILPAICGRVCPQETQCELTCVVGHKLDPTGIGRLERFIGDLALKEGWGETDKPAAPTGKKAAMVGSGPASITCAVDLARAGVEVTIYEALHTAGGVLKYGIPEFRLPKKLIDEELQTLERLGVKVVTNAIIGRLYTIPQMMEEMGYDAIFVGVGAGYPNFMGIPGEGFNGIFSANEYLTRVNLMAGYDHPSSDTPVGMGKNIAVIGSGNTAMDACRVSLRMGAQNVYCVYRRTRKESPARAEELEHAIEEGVQFNWLTAPIRILGNDEGWVKAMECIRMELGEPDASGRRRPIPKEGTEFIFEVDTVVYAIGTSANPIIQQTTPGLETNKWGYIKVDEETQMTSLPGVFAGGDIVTGGATVILAMGAGRTAARGMLKYMGLKPPPRPPQKEWGRIPKGKVPAHLK
jgi:glutamate synthase (NADPH/NADH) small chain